MLAESKKSFVFCLFCVPVTIVAVLRVFCGAVLFAQVSPVTSLCIIILVGWATRRAARQTPPGFRWNAPRTARYVDPAFKLNFLFVTKSIKL